LPWHVSAHKQLQAREQHCQQWEQRLTWRLHAVSWRAAVRSEMRLVQKERSISCLSWASKSVSAFCACALSSSLLFVTGCAGTSSLSFFAAPVLMLKVPACPSQTGESESPMLEPLCQECPGPACCGTSPSGMVTLHWKRAFLPTPPPRVKLCPLNGATVRDPCEAPPLTSAGCHDTCKSTLGPSPHQGRIAPPQSSVDTTAVLWVSSRIGTGTVPTPAKTPRPVPVLPVLTQTSILTVAVPPSSTQTLPGVRESSSLTSAKFS